MTLAQTESISARTLALPFFNNLTDNQIADVCDNLVGLLANFTL